MLWINEVSAHLFFDGVPDFAYYAFRAVLDYWELVHSGRKAFWGLMIVSSICVTAFLLLLVFLAAIPLVLAFGVTAGRPWSIAPYGHLQRRFKPTLTIASSIEACASLYASTWRTQPHRSRRLARRLRSVESQLLSLHRTCGRLPLRTHRRREIKHHTGLVVASLRQAEARIDRDGNAATVPLAAMLLTVAERIADGRIGALLDEPELDATLQPARDWEPFKLATAAVLIAACATGVSVLKLPDDATTYAIGACGIVVLAMLYGRRVQQFLDLLGVLGGGK
ncbi:hypothetical protein [Streptomyces sp. AF1A]|jgi:hypothetical protein|uniref:hypothetical protein n=1 Tax=Streptomyces sp. AF1A TaxID=3394350 RepID=UPI0039BCE7CA